MKPFDIFIAYVAWGNGGGKIRPVLVLDIDGDKATLLNITTQYENKSDTVRKQKRAVRARYFRIDDYKQAGLNKQSYVDIMSGARVSAVSIIGKPQIGKLTNADKERLLEFLKKK